MKEPKITFEGECENPLSKLLKESFDSLNENLPEELYDIDGMSGRKYRSLINSLIKKMNDVRYLEIGSWKGSTICSALYNNSGTFVCVDNWSEFGGPKIEFEENTKKYINQNTQFKFIEEDFRKLDYNNLGKFNIYFYDGPHHEKDHIDGTQLPLNALDENYILIVDDWNWHYVQNGTRTGLTDSGQTIVSSIKILTDENGVVPVLHGKTSDWHNGYFIAVMKKTQ